MIQRLNLSIALNSLSIGQCGFNILRELYRRKVQCLIFPKGNVDLSAYRIDPQFGAWIERAINTRYQKIDRKVPTVACWHINGSEFKPSDRQVLLTFHETDSPTEHEINVVNQQDFTFFSSSWSVENFKTYGAQNVGFVPLGFDEDFVKIPNLTNPNTTQWSCIGKAEMRKNTQLIIQTWVKRYAENPKHFLNLAVTNPFFQPQQMEGFYANCFMGKPKPFNVNILPYMKTNFEVNQMLNMIDVDLSSFSSAEGWGLPGFNATALGKWAVVTDCSAHRDWATKDNAILVEAGPMRPCYDNVFFAPGQPWNQGNHYQFSSEQLISAMEAAEKLAKTPNPEGEKLRERFTWGKTVEQILEKIGD